MPRRHVLVRTLLYLHHQLERASLDQALSPSQYLLMHFLVEEPRLAADFAAVMRFRQPSVGELVRRLEERGLIERYEDTDDRRTRFVRITDEGRRAFADYEAYLTRHLAGFLGEDVVAAADEELVPLYELWNEKRIARFENWARNHSARGKRMKRLAASGS
jgi:DNA-binding MarR family transcriptional regulator